MLRIVMMRLRAVMVTQRVSYEMLRIVMIRLSAVMITLRVSYEMLRIVKSYKTFAKQTHNCEPWASIITCRRHS